MDLAMDGNRDHTAHKSYQKKKKKKKQPIKNGGSHQRAKHMPGNNLND